MRLSLLAFIALTTSAIAQEDPGPSPTESVGCEPHGDHWHCDAPATSDIFTLPTVTSSSNDDGDGDDSVTPGPSPTESVGCEPHGDHWHCDAPATTTATDDGHGHEHDHDEDEDGEEGSSETPPPSPTESVGCEPHGDHWHCDGPRETGDASATPSGTGEEDAQETGGGGDEDVGGIVSVKVSGVVALAVGAAAVLL